MAKIPTLHSGPVSVISNPADIVAYLIRHSLKNPGFTSSFIENDLISFRKLEAEYTDKLNLIAIYQQQLQSVILRNLPTEALNVNVDWEDVDGFNYKLSIDVSDQTGTTILVSGKVVITKDNINITFNHEE